MTENTEPGTGDEHAPTEELRARIAELEDLWRRALAEQANLAKRHARDLERVRSATRAEVAGLVPPVIDNLERALGHATSDPEVIVDGVRAVRDQAVQLLAKLGYPRQDEVGTAFDPARHTAVAAVTDPRYPPGTVVDVVQPGYGELRPAQVVVATKADDD
jgi:molecular chaperone GrpE